jgi:hypothetical protein
MSRTTLADATLDAVVPVTPRWRSALAVTLGIALLVGAGASASVARPHVVPASNDSEIHDAPGGAVSTLDLEGGAVWQRVESVTGPDVAAAWLVDGPAFAEDGHEQGTTHGLPHVLHRGERLTLVIRWSSVCGKEARVRTLGMLGTIREEDVPADLTPGSRPRCDGA